MKNPMTTRRSLLATTPALLTGCTLVQSDENRFTLGDIRVTNATGEQQNVDLRLHRNGEIVAEEDWTIPKSGGAETVQMSWADDPAKYLLEVRVADGDWVSSDFSNVSGSSDCTLAFVTIESPTATVAIGALAAPFGELDCSPQ